MNDQPQPPRWVEVLAWYQARGLLPPTDPAHVRPAQLPPCPPGFTAAQWADVCDWYWSGFENGWNTALNAAFEAAYQLTAHAWQQTQPPEYIPRTPYVARTSNRDRPPRRRPTAA